MTEDHNDQPPKRRGVALKGLTLISSEGVADGVVTLSAEQADRVDPVLLAEHRVWPRD